MPTGSFIGVGNFKGYWNASINSGSNQDLRPPLSGSTPAGAGGLLADSGSNGGYNGAIGLTASVGDYWQVNTAGSTEIDGVTRWELNDWVVYQGDESVSPTRYTWNRLSVTDTIAATVIGDASQSGLKNTLLASASAISGPSAAGTPTGQFGEVLFVSASDAAGNNKFFDGNTNFTFDPEVGILNLTGTLRVSGEIQATQVHTNYVTSSVLYDDGDTKFGNSADDQHQFTGSVYCTLGVTASTGISGSYFMGDGSRLTGITAGSTLGNPQYGNAAPSRVSYWGVLDGASEYGLSGSANFSFFTSSNDLQVTGTIRATDFYAAGKIYHEGDSDTYIDFNAADQITLRAGGVNMVQLVEGASEDYLRLGTDTSTNVDIRMGSVGKDDTLWVDGGSTNVGIRTAPSGVIEALVVSGSTLFGSASANTHRFTGSLVVSNGIYTTQDIIHWDDADTKITFTNDQIDFTAGGTTFLTLDEDGQNLVTIGDGTDIDLKVRSLNDNFVIFVQGDTDNVGIGYNAPTKKLSVSGSTTFGRESGEGDTHQFTGSIYVSDDIHVEDKIYGLGDPNTYLDFSTNDQIHMYAGGVAGAILTSTTFKVNPGNVAGFDFGVETANFLRGFHVDGASDNVGIRCAPSGTIQALTVSGSTLFGSASANTHQFTGSIYVSDNIAFGGNLHNASDDDTYIDFQNDQIRLYAGNVQFADFDESGGQNITTLNGLGADIDFIIKSSGATGAGAGTNLTHTIFVEGSSAKVGIAESSPGAQLDVSGSTILGRHDGATISYHQVSGTLELTGNIGVNTPATDYSLTLPNLDSLAGRGMAYAWSTYSSARYKQDVATMSNPLDKAKQLRGVEFTWKDSGQKDFGFIAEEVGKVLPQLVSYEPDGTSAIGMDYSRITSLLVECVKSQQYQIETQEQRIKTLEKKLKS